MSEPQQEFERRAAQLLAASVEDLDAGTRAALQRARRRAIEAVTPPVRPAWRYLAPAGAAAAVLLAVVLFVQTGRLQQGGDAAIADPGPDLELVTDADAWEIAQEPDLEFIEWAAAIARQQGAGS